MSILTRMLRQTAVYWAPSGSDAYGRTTFADPVELSCRWEDTAEEFIDAQGERQVSKAKVYVGEDIEPGGYIMLGDLDDVDEDANPREVSDAWAIRSFAKTPNLKATAFLRLVMV